MRFRGFRQYRSRRRAAKRRPPRSRPSTPPFYPASTWNMRRPSTFPSPSSEPTLSTRPEPEYPAMIPGSSGTARFSDSVVMPGSVAATAVISSTAGRSSTTSLGNASVLRTSQPDFAGGVAGSPAPQYYAIVIWPPLANSSVPASSRRPGALRGRTVRVPEACR